MHSKFSTGAVRAFIVFGLVAAFLWLVLFMLGRAGIDLYAEPVLIIIGAGWCAYWVFKKTEYGRY